MIPKFSPYAICNLSVANAYEESDDIAMAFKHAYNTLGIASYTRKDQLSLKLDVADVC